MSEGSSTDDDWYAPADSQNKGQNEGNCWECGKKFLSLDRLISHYKSHNVKATCHICDVTFRHMTSLLTHLDNVHEPHCEHCDQWFRSAWELNKHSAFQCLGSALSDSNPSFSYISQQTQNSVNFEMASHKDILPKISSFSVAEDHSYAESCNNDLHMEQLNVQQSPDIESMPLESTDIQQERPETPDNAIEYTVGEADDSCQTENTDDSTDTADHDGERWLSDEGETHSGNSTNTESLHLDDPESDCDSTSSGSSSDSSYIPRSKKKKKTATHHGANTSMCTACGKGPFRNVKVHLLHCTGKKINVQCSVCKQQFLSEESLRNHKLRLYSCDICGQVFPYWNSYNYHQCPKGSHSVLFFCSTAMPKACNLCKAFFNSEQTLLNHIVRAHSTVVSTKVSFVPKSTALTENKVSSVVSNTAAKSSISNSGHILVSSHALTCQRPSVVSQVINGKLSSDYRSLSPVIKSSLPPSPSPSHPGVVPVTSRFINGGTNKFMLLHGAPSTISQVVSEKNTSNLQVTVMQQNNAECPPQMIPSQEMTSSGQSLLNAQSGAPCSPVRPPPASSITIRLGTDSAFDQTTNQSVGAINNSPAACPISTPMPPLSILGMFKNESREVTLMKRMNTSWRLKAPYPCRQCGAISRQPSIIISHRYLHRGRRSHRCQCGRTFKHRLHLLRHCVQHAEAVSYICVSCGKTFIGARLLAEHMNGNFRKRRSSGHSWKFRITRKCQMPFSCDCGQLFVRPSAYIWHQLKNRTKVKQ